MKKLLIGILVCIFSIGFVSCTNKEETKGKEESSDEYNREELSFGIKDFEVKGELVTPKNGKKPYKIAVIVGGSGPTNRDASIQSYHPYKDIAEGLAEKGIASFRYDKRAFSHKDKLQSAEKLLDFTIKEEYLDDYNEVIKYIGERKDIDKNNIYTIGHSQGGYIIPMLEKTNSQPKGYIFLAANSTRIEDALIEQCDKILKTPNLPENQKKQYEEMKKQGQKIKALTPMSPNEIIAGTSVKYWLELKNYNVLEEVKSINKPMIFLQGLDDFNVPERDLNSYKDALKGKENAEYKTYEGLTHVLTKGTNTTVEPIVIDDIYSFINKNS